MRPQLFLGEGRTFIAPANICNDFPWHRRPGSCGGVVVSFSNYAKLLPFLLPTLGVVTVGQLVVSVWSLVSKWDDAYVYSLKSQDRNSELQFHWQSLTDNVPPDFDNLFDKLSAEDSTQARADEKWAVSGKERRKGMHAALF